MRAGRTATAVVVVGITTFAAAIGPLSVAADPVNDPAARPVQMREVFSPDGSIERLPVQLREQSKMSGPERVQAESAAESATVTAIQKTGPSSERFDLVLVGDGYTRVDLPEYHADARTQIDLLFSVEPYKSYRTLFNIWQVDVVSRQSGVDDDPIGTKRATALDSYFNCGGVQRLICLNSAKATAAAQAAPAADQVFVLVNSSTYGGSGGRVTTVSGGNQSSGKIAAHELGHSIGGLADEYSGGGPACAPIENDQANVSTLDRAAQLSAKRKWWRWIGAETPDGGTISTYEGGAYCDTGVFRPSENSIMRSLGKEFNGPSREKMIAAFYAKAVVARATRVDQTTFQVDPSVVGSHRITWRLDGAPIGSSSGAGTFTLPPNARTGAHTVQVEVVDTTSWVRDPAIRQKLTWSKTFTLDPAS